MSQDQDAPPPQYPDDPCLSRLAEAIQTRDGLPLDLEHVTFSAPRAVERRPDGSNTAVDVLGTGGPVTVWYERLDLVTLARLDLRIRVPFTPAADHPVQILRAIAVYFKRSLSLVDCDPECFTQMELAPNGCYRLTLRANANSYGWIGKVDLALEPRVDLTQITQVRGLSAFAYTPPPV